MDGDLAAESLFARLHVLTLQQRLLVWEETGGIDCAQPEPPGVQADFRFDGPQLLSGTLRIERHLDGKIGGAEDDAGQTGGGGG